MKREKMSENWRIFLFQDDDDKKGDAREEEGVTEDEEISEVELEEQERSYSEILEDLDVLF